jgi:hypothetical protein
MTNVYTLILKKCDKHKDNFKAIFYYIKAEMSEVYNWYMSLLRTKIE